MLPEALARALKVADRPDGDPGDLQGAAALLRDYGSDQDLKQLAAGAEVPDTGSEVLQHTVAVFHRGWKST
jgi:hypothetical protein